MINILKTCRLFLSIISLFILFGMTIVIAQEGLLDGKVFVGKYREDHKRGPVKEAVWVKRR